MLTRTKHRTGFSLVELMIGIAIIAILMTQALPNFISWIQNLQIRNAAESIMHGLQIAKANAVNTNLSSTFLLTNTLPVAANVTTASPATSGTSWMVRYVDTTGTTQFIQGWSITDGSKNATVSVNPTSASPPAPDGSFTFNALGRFGAASIPPACVYIDVTNSVTYTGKRPMRVIVSPGGQTLMCDPNKVDATNAQFCPVGCP